MEVVLACVRGCALQVAASLAQRAPPCVLAHWMLLLPLHLHPPTPTKPSKPVRHTRPPLAAWLGHGMTLILRCDWGCVGVWCSLGGVAWPWGGASVGGVVRVP